jgi:hypothetical protein
MASLSFLAVLLGLAALGASLDPASTTCARVARGQQVRKRHCPTEQSVGLLSVKGPLQDSVPEWLRPCVRSTRGVLLCPPATENGPASADGPSYHAHLPHVSRSPFRIMRTILARAMQADG